MHSDALAATTLPNPRAVGTTLRNAPALASAAEPAGSRREGAHRGGTASAT
jgi:hypothetical protein